MAGVDLNVYRFDYDLTFAALLMNADGTVYRTYAGRDSSSALSHLSLPGFVRVLNETLQDHDEYVKNPRPPRRKKKRTIEQIPRWAREIKNGKARDCYHCHMVYEGRIEDLQERRRWTREQAWLWPDPVQLGLTLDRDDQTLVKQVARGSVADKAGVEAGHHITGIGGRSVRTFGDVQRVLHETSGGSTRLALGFKSDREAWTKTLRLPKGWKEPTPLVYSWRGSKWSLSPKPGFGGKPLDAAEKKALGLPEDHFAFRVNYLVTWGPNRQTGHNARQAGIRKGDVIVSVAGKHDFRDMNHYHAWFRLTQKVGTRVPVERIRNGKRETLQLKVIE